MRTKILGLLAVGLLAGPMAAHAVTLQINDSGILTGATGVEVGGTLYNVHFLDGTCADLFNGCDNAADDFAFTTKGDAQTAAPALLDQRSECSAAVLSTARRAGPWRVRPGDAPAGDAVHPPTLAQSLPGATPTKLDSFRRPRPSCGAAPLRSVPCSLASLHEHDHQPRTNKKPGAA